MKIKFLEIKNFRNYDREKFFLDNNLIILNGLNAQGKTNILESIYVLSLTKSYRSKYLKSLIKHDEKYCYIKSTLRNIDNKDLNIIYTFNSMGDRKYLINKKPQRNSKEIFGKIKIIKFSPEDILLIKGPPSIRKKFIDIHISQTNSFYLEKLLEYKRTKKQKNFYLKITEKNKIDTTLLKIYNKKLAECIYNIINIRKEFTKKFIYKFKKNYFEISNSDEEISLNYNSFFKEKNKDEIYKIINLSIEKEKLYKRSLIGLQKDDLYFEIDGKSATLYSSQGQQRSIILSLFISMIDYFNDVTGEYPILLLDDVLSELDDERKKKLINIFEDKYQTFITTTEFDNIKDKIKIPYIIYDIQNGKIIRRIEEER